MLSDSTPNPAAVRYGIKTINRLARKRVPQKTTLRNHEPHPLASNKANLSQEATKLQTLSLHEAVQPRKRVFN